MNFLALCQRLRSDAGIPGSGPLSVLGQSGELAKVVAWIHTAYEDIQNQRPDWKFLEEEVSFSTVAAQREYTPTQAGVSTLAQWKTSAFTTLYSIASDEGEIMYIPWEEFKPVYNFGSARTNTGRPRAYTIQPDNTLMFDVTPDAVYTFNGECYLAPDTMSENTDVPIFPERFHMVIVYRALMLYGADYAAEEKYTHGQNEYKKLIKRLELDQGRRISWGAPLA